MIEFHGITLCGPVLAASGPATATVANIRACESAGAGAVIIKSVASERMRSETPFAPRRMYYRDGSLYMLSSLRREFLGVDEGVFLLTHAKSKTHLPVVGSAAGCTEHFDEWASLLDRLCSAGADMLQLDTLYCFSMTGSDPKSTLTELRTFGEKMQRDLGCPVVLKLTPEVPVETAKAVLVGSRVGVVLLDSMAVGLPIDASTGDVAFRGVRSFGPCRAAGRILFPLATLYIHELAPLLPGRLCAGGGVFSAVDAAWLLHLGATCVQVATAVCVFGFRRLSDIALGVNQSLADLAMRLAGQRQMHLPYLVASAGVVVHCEGNTVRCEEEACRSVVMCEGGLDACEGCGLCIDVCPTGFARFEEVRK